MRFFSINRALSSKNVIAKMSNDTRCLSLSLGETKPKVWRKSNWKNIDTRNSTKSESSRKQSVWSYNITVTAICSQSNVATKRCDGSFILFTPGMTGKCGNLATSRENDEICYELRHFGDFPNDLRQTRSLKCGET